MSAPEEITLATIDNFTAQEVFTYVVEKLVEQGKRSFGSIDGRPAFCLYRGPLGRRCAAGWCMSDSEAAVIGEGQGVMTSSFQAVYSGKHLDLLRILQQKHDLTSGRITPKRFEDTAARFGLEMPK